MALNLDDRIKRLDHHLRYEIDMLLSTLVRKADSKDKTLCNAMIESFCVHARNIEEFLRKRGRDNYVDANYRPFDPARNPLPGDFFDRINNQIHHLIYDNRKDADIDKISAPEREAWARCLMDEVAEFEKHLLPDLKHINLTPSTIQLTAGFPGACTTFNNTVTISTTSLDISKSP